MGAGFLAGEGFEGVEEGGFKILKTELGNWNADPDHAEVQGAHSKSGKKALRIHGGGNRTVELELQEVTQGETMLSFWAERWTKREPFFFRVEGKRQGKWSEIYKGDRRIKVGGFLTLVEIPLAAGTEGIRFVATSPWNSGVMIDDLLIEKVNSMVVKTVTTIQPVVPVLIRKKDNPVLGLEITTEGRGDTRKVTALKVDLEGTTDPTVVKAVRVLFSGGDQQLGASEVFGEAKKVGEAWVCKGEVSLLAGKNFFWVSVELNESASLEGWVDGRVLGVSFADGEMVEPKITAPEGSQRIGFALRLRGDDGSEAFRIPGLATTNEGTLIAVYDVRYRSGGDLPGDIDVGMNRSSDGGQTWDKMKVIIDMGNDPQWDYDGVGDPAILVDRETGRIWVGATWSHGNRSWHGSGQGMTPEKTGQVMMVYSDDDGLTWSKPINFTKQVKKPEWHFLLHGPGAGITMKDGTLVFAMQYQDGDKQADGRKKGTPFSTIMTSKDRGKTWVMGRGIKSNTTEAQVVELADGSLMLNCRDNRGGARTVGVTKDLGQTWELHPTDRKALKEPVCMASLLRVGERLVFSNPNTRKGRYKMTLKVSEDDGMTWPEKWNTLYDSRSGSGYSCLAPIGKDQVGVLYEGPTEIYFLRLLVN